MLKIRWRNNTFDERESHSKLDIKRADLGRQSYAHFYDYSFGSPDDDWNKENKSFQTGMTVSTEIEPKVYKRKNDLYAENAKVKQKNKVNKTQKKLVNSRSIADVKVIVDLI
jgi:hypothetical protein